LVSFPRITPGEIVGYWIEMLRRVMFSIVTQP
jgi:hypothetical protein